VVDGRAVLHPTGGTPLTFFATQPNGEIEPLDNIEAAAQLTSGSWLIMDGDARSIFEFAADGTFLGPFAAGRVRRLAISAAGVVAGIERNRRSVLVFDDTGRPLGQIQLRGETYDLRDAEDLAFDALGHLYVLVEDRIGVFSPFPPSGGGAAVSAGAGYRLLTVYAVPDGAPGRFDRARAFALDASGTAFLYDDRAHRILVYR
jgi:hypothetical protein